MLAKWPTQAEKDKYRTLNQTLLSSLIVLTIIKIIFAGIFFWHKTPWLTPLAAFPILNYLVIYWVVKGNGLGYPLVVLFFGKSIINLLEGDLGVTNGVIYLLALATAILAEFLRRRLFPNSTFFMNAKKDKDGNYIL